MKTVKYIIFAIAFIFLSFNGVAGNTPTGSGNTNIFSIIKNHISYTNTSKSGKTQKVTFTFTVNEKGNVDAVAAKVENLQERKSLETQFSKLNFAGLTQGTTYSIDVNFVNY
jgi:hypothetical protein